MRPDFSQVEADDVYQRINNRYPVYIPEKRPFFLDPTSSFATNFQLLHTRTIVDPYAGARFSGNWGGFGAYALGALERDTPPERFEGTEAHPKDTLWGAFRSRWEGSMGTVGLMSTSMSHGSDFNRVLSVDASPRFGNLGLQFQGVQSWTRLGEPQSIAGHAIHASASYQFTRWMNFSTSYRSLSKDFKTLAGFEPEVGYRYSDASISINYKPSESNRLIKGYYIYLSYFNKNKTDGSPLEFESKITQSITLPSRISFVMINARGTEYFQGIPFKTKLTSIAAAWNRYEKFNINSNYAIADLPRYDYFNPRAARHHAHTLSLQHVSGGLTVTQTIQRHRLEEANGDLSARQTSFQTVVQYVFGQGWSLRLFRTWDRARWVDFDLENPNTYAQLLLTYQPSAFTRVLAGINVRSQAMSTLQGIPLSETRENRAFVKCVFYL